eukprot:939203-Amphidinium_carterae.1
MERSYSANTSQRSLYWNRVHLVMRGQRSELDRYTCVPSSVQRRVAVLHRWSVWCASAHKDIGSFIDDDCVECESPLVPRPIDAELNIACTTGTSCHACTAHTNS